MFPPDELTHGKRSDFHPQRKVFTVPPFSRFLGDFGYKNPRFPEDFFPHVGPKTFFDVVFLSCFFQGFLEQQSLFAMTFPKLGTFPKSSDALFKEPFSSKSLPTGLFTSPPCTS